MRPESNHDRPESAGDPADLIPELEPVISKRKYRKKYTYTRDQYVAQIEKTKLTAQVLATNGMHRIQLGDTVDLMELSMFAALIGVTETTARSQLRALQVPLIGIDLRTYFNVVTLDKAMYYMGRLGNKGWAAPGGRMAARQSMKKTNYIQRPKGLTDEDVKVTESPAFLAEWLGLAKSSKETRMLRVLASMEKMYDRIAYIQSGITKKGSTAGQPRRRSRRRADFDPGDAAAPETSTDTEPDELFQCADRVESADDPAVHTAGRDFDTDTDSQERSEGLGPDESDQDVERHPERGSGGGGLAGRNLSESYGLARQ